MEFKFYVNDFGISKMEPKLFVHGPGVYYKILSTEMTYDYSDGLKLLTINVTNKDHVDLNHILSEFSNEVKYTLELIDTYGTSIGFLMPGRFIRTDFIDRIYPSLIERNDYVVVEPSSVIPLLEKQFGIEITDWSRFITYFGSFLIANAFLLDRYYNLRIPIHSVVNSHLFLSDEEFDLYGHLFISDLQFWQMQSKDGALKLLHNPIIIRELL